MNYTVYFISLFYLQYLVQLAILFAYTEPPAFSFPFLRYFFPEGGREYERGREEMEMNELHVVDDVSELGDEEEEREEEEEEEGEEIPIVDEDVVEDVDIEENPVQDIKETKDEDSLVVVSGPKEELEEIKREEFQKQKKWFSFFSFSKIKKF